MDLVVVGVLASAASAYYYLRILVALFMTGSEATEEEADVAHRPLDRSGATVIAVSAILLIVMGLWPALIERVASLL
jgi:NADH-quinone oxidoreductase subunit N